MKMENVCQSMVSGPLKLTGQFSRDGIDCKHFVWKIRVKFVNSHWYNLIVVHSVKYLTS